MGLQCTFKHSPYTNINFKFAQKKSSILVTILTPCFLPLVPDLSLFPVRDVMITLLGTGGKSAILVTSTTQDPKISLNSPSAVQSQWPVPCKYLSILHIGMWIAEAGKDQHRMNPFYSLWCSASLRRALDFTASQHRRILPCIRTCWLEQNGLRFSHSRGERTSVSG